MEVMAAPGEPLHAVEAAGKGLGLVEDSVAIGIDQNLDRVAGRIRFWITILRALSDEEPAAGIERHCAGIANERILRDERDREVGRHGREERDVPRPNRWPQKGAK